MKDGNFYARWNKCENEMISMSQPWDKEKSECQAEFEPMTSQTPGGRSIHLSYGELVESEAIY